MAEIVPFTGNFSDLSNDDGYQFEFFCERCGNGYRSPFQTDLMSKGSGVLRAAGGLFGGLLGDMSNAADDMLDRGTNSAAKDKALREGVEAVRPHFKQCRACSNWVCIDVCWNTDIGQCLDCAPVVADELARAQAEAQVEQIKEKVKEVDWTSDLDLTTRAKVQCPSCGAAVDGGKFCGECGGKLNPTVFCTECGNEVKAGAKFCGECGTAVTG